MTDEKLTQEIVDLVSYHSGYKKEKISLETSFFHDLGVDRDDGNELITEFMDKFKVDIGSLEYDRHFGSGGANIRGCLMYIPLLLFGVVSLIFLPLKKLKKIISPNFERLTVQDMVDAAKAGKWVLEYTPKPNK